MSQLNYTVHMSDYHLHCVHFLSEVGVLPDSVKSHYQFDGCKILHPTKINLRPIRKQRAGKARSLGIGSRHSPSVVLK